MNTWRWIYKVVRSLLLTLILVTVALVMILYVLLSIPPVQNKIRDIAETQLTEFLGGKVEIGRLSIFPLNEVLIQDVTIRDPKGEKCVGIEKLGGGINLWRLVFRREIELTFIELIGLDADIYQKKEGEPLNIDFLIKAFEPKDKNKPPTPFDLKIHNIVLRKGKIRFSKLWKDRETDPDKIDFNYLEVENLSADVALPKLSNDLNEIDLRRLTFTEKSGLIVKEISGLFTIDKERLAVSDFNLSLPESEIKIAPLTVPFSLFSGKAPDENLRVKILDSRVTLSNLSAFVPLFKSADFTIPISGVIQGNPNDISIQGFMAGMPEGGGKVTLDGSLTNLQDKGRMRLSGLSADIDLTSAGLAVLGRLIPSQQADQIISRLQYVRASVKGDYALNDGATNLDLTLETGPAEVTILAEGQIRQDAFQGNLSIELPRLDADKIAGQNVLSFVSDANVKIDGKVDFKNIKASSGDISFDIGRVGILNRDIGNITGNLMKEANEYILEITAADHDLDGNLQARLIIDNNYYTLDLESTLNDFDTYSSLISDTKKEGVEMKGAIALHAEGSDADNASGTLDVNNFYLKTANGKSLEIDKLQLVADQFNPESKSVTLTSEIADFSMSGDFVATAIPSFFRETLHNICPAIFPPHTSANNCGSGEFAVDIKNADKIIDFFSLPIIPLTELNIKGRFDGREGTASLQTDIPYIQQGKNKLITGTYLDLQLNSYRKNLDFNFGTVYPTKKGDLKLDLNLAGGAGEYSLGMDFNKGLNTSFYGSADLTGKIERDPEGNLEGVLTFLPSVLYLNGSEWRLDNSTITYTRELLDVDNFSLHHDGQYVHINGDNKADGSGLILLQLADINLDYLFETLNIPHVNFGGTATGEVTATGLLSKDIDVKTRKLFIKDLSYNGGLIGDGDISGALDMKEKMVAIGALINEGGREVAKVDGGVWFGCDSLSFDFDAKSVNIEFMQPFMAAFSSRVEGRASGKAKLYGTFSDIDMTGVIAAEDARFLVDYINVTYTASDTVYLYPGRIVIPEVTIHDDRGGTALVNGEITHEYFHRPGFRFNMTDMNRLLVYDTNRKLNNIWYGTIYAKGMGEITGQPGWVTIRADVVTEKGSDFTFVLSDEQEAVKTNFLTFSDRRKEAYEASLPQEEEPEFLKRFRKNDNSDDGGEPDVFTMDLRATITPDITLNLIMDPIAGDKIKAEGEGAMNMTYSSKTDELRLYGKYTLEKGTYNFSLQDIILKDFTIKPGSTIAFTGDPYSGILDITAAYRVNTSLTELDQSFATDRELNRTSVPVEALLIVTGSLLNPHIAFDIELPTVTEETQRKVKSIISTEDMMSKEVLYLVALNKFYPPEYMTTSNSGGEWASIASSTISSQIQNLIGQITDKFTLSPSFRSDKGDFSDVEVDVALSSNLFNNRLLLNGNLGYRDPSNSSTMFVGDFDLEYLLTKSGNWRLKAYNHFNDQNYYLKSALTTQGIGIVWRKDFGFLNGTQAKSRKEDDETPTDEGEEIIEEIQESQSE